MLRMMGTSAFDVATRMLGWTLAVPTIEGTIADNIAWMLVVIGLSAVGVWQSWTVWRALALYVVAYAVLMVTWPYPSPRLLSVIVPFILLAVVLGAVRLTRHLRPSARRAIMIVLTGLVVFGGAQRISVRLEEAERCNREGSQTPPNM
jgi:hypothetical protein